MIKIPMSRAASSLLRALIERAGVPRERILLTESRSTDWQSLTFTGEQHEFQLRVTGQRACEMVERLCLGLEEAEFDLHGHVVIDIGLRETPRAAPDGSIIVAIEALTITAD